MIDFDDIDETAAQLAEQGELSEVALQALGKEGVEPPKPYKGGWLWPMKRNSRFPDYDCLPEKLQANVGKSWQGRGCRLRLIIFYGAGDSFPFWASFMTDCPEWVETAVYEWPAHGSRESEDRPANVDGLVADAMTGLEHMFKQHAAGGKLEGAPFVLMGHSIGVLIMLGVAERAKANWGLEPSCCVVMDRGAPQHPLCSDFGAELLQRDSLDFIRIFNPQVFNMFMQAKAKGRDEDSTAARMCKMWQEDIKYQQNVKPEGFHMFRCPLHVFVAMQNWSMDSEEAVAAMDPATLAWHKERAAILGSKEGSQALWDFPCYEDWRRWTTDRFELHTMDQDHAAMKLDKKFAKQLWDIIKPYQCSLDDASA